MPLARHITADRNARRPRRRRQVAYTTDKPPTHATARVHIKKYEASRLKRSTPNPGQAPHATGPRLKNVLTTMLGRSRQNVLFGRCA